MLQEINFSLIGECNAKCAFCPRKEHNSQIKTMPIELVEKIVDELCSDEFKERYQVLHSHVGENGESTLHPQFIDILRLLKKTGHAVDLYTNFSGLTDNKLEAIFEEELVTGINVNIDGLTPESYNLMKKLDYDKTERRILSFLEKRKERNVSLTIHILTAENYTKAVRKYFGTWPHAIPRDWEFIPNEAERILEKWKPQLSATDGIGISSCLMWAERNHVPKKHGDYSCFNLGRVKNSAFVAPNGDWYLCCFDVGNEVVFGNLNESSLVDIYENDKRAQIINWLETKQFDQIGLPCRRVDVCQVVNPYG
jgi:radical SAM protein with 4Fe4S-binding SPASM domain